MNPFSLPRCCKADGMTLPSSPDMTTIDSSEKDKKPQTVSEFQDRLWEAFFRMNKATQNACIATGLKPEIHLYPHMRAVPSHDPLFRQAASHFPNSSNPSQHRKSLRPHPYSRALNNTRVSDLK